MNLKVSLPMPTNLWCWRCQAMKPMLTEAEWAELEPLLTAHTEAVIRYRRDHGSSLAEALSEVSPTAILDAYERLTGERETDLEVIRHHRTSLYGPPCGNCGRPLRTPRATMCVECGSRVRSGDDP